MQFIFNFIQRRLIVIIILFITAIAFLFARKTLLPHVDEAKLVEVLEIEAQNIEFTENFIGTIKSYQATSLFAKTNGIIEVQVKPNDKVKKGQFIAKIINDDIKRRYEIAIEQASIANAQYNRSIKLHDSKVISKSNLEEKRQKLLSAETELANARLSFEELNTYAPHDGIIANLHINQTHHIKANELITLVYSPSKLYIEFDLPEQIAAKIENDAKIIVHDQILKLDHVQKIINPETGMCSAYANYDCPDCIIGTTTELKLVTYEKTDAIIIPASSIFYRQGKKYVYKVDDFKTQLTPITTGNTFHDQVEIISGLQDDDDIILRATELLQPNQTVKIAGRDS